MLCCLGLISTSLPPYVLTRLPGAGRDAGGGAELLFSQQVRREHQFLEYSSLYLPLLDDTVP